MNKKMMAKIAVDIGMTVTLLFLMSYMLIGRNTHEWLGASMMILFVAHHILNIRWYKNLFKGKYSSFRILQTVVAFLLLGTMLGSMSSGIILSWYVFSVVQVGGSSAWARTVHHLCGYWGFVLMAFHLGLHWRMMLSMASRMFVGKTSRKRTAAARITGALIAGYGAYAFVTNRIWAYMLMIDPYAFFDFQRPLVLFFLEYLAIMGLFVFIAHYLSRLLSKQAKSKD